MVPCIPFGFRKYSFDDSTTKNLCDLDQITSVSQNTMPSSVNQVKEHLPQRLEGTKKDNVYKGLVISTQRLSKEGGTVGILCSTHTYRPRKRQTKTQQPKPTKQLISKKPFQKSKYCFPYLQTQSSLNFWRSRVFGASQQRCCSASVTHT